MTPPAPLIAPPSRRSPPPAVVVKVSVAAIVNASLMVCRLVLLLVMPPVPSAKELPPMVKADAPALKVNPPKRKPTASFSFSVVMLDVPKKRPSPEETVPVGAPGVVVPVVQFIPVKVPSVGLVDQASLPVCA